MPRGDGPQFRSIASVCEAYANAEIPAFAVAYDKDINLRYEGDSMSEGEQILQNWLARLKQEGTRAIYQLRLYEDLGGKRIKSNTPYDMAFKFVLNDRETENLPARYEGNNSGLGTSDLIRLLNENADLKADNAVLKMKLQEWEELPDEPPPQPPPPPPNFGEQLLKKFEPALGAIGERIADWIIPPPAKIAGVVLDTGNVDEEKQIATAVKRLKNSIPDKPGVGIVLTKLADIAENNPQTFGYYMGMIMKM